MLINVECWICDNCRRWRERLIAAVAGKVKLLEVTTGSLLASHVHPDFKAAWRNRGVLTICLALSLVNFMTRKLFDQDPFYKMCSTGDFWTWRYGDRPVDLPTTCTCRKFTQGYCYPLQWLLFCSKNMFTSLNILVHVSKKVRYGIQRHNLRPAVDEAWSSHGSTYTWNRWEIEVHLWWEVWQPQWPSQALSFAVAQIAEESEMVLELCTWILPEIMVAWTIVEWDSSRRILE